MYCDLISDLHVAEWYMYFDLSLG